MVKDYTAWRRNVSFAKTLDDDNDDDDNDDGDNDGNKEGGVGGGGGSRVEEI